MPRLLLIESKQKRKPKLRRNKRRPRKRQKKRQPLQKQRKKPRWLHRKLLLRRLKNSRRRQILRLPP